MNGGFVVPVNCLHATISGDDQAEPYPVRANVFLTSRNRPKLEISCVRSNDCYRSNDCSDHRHDW